MGSGGVGGYFGARLARAGYPVSFIARGPHLRAIQQRGLAVEAPDESFRIQAPATDSPAEIGPVDFVLFSVKLWDTKDAGLACKPLIGPGTAVVSLQNGVDSEAVLQSVLGPDHVMGGVAEISAAISTPGHIRKVSPFHRIRFGEMDRQRSERSELFGQCLAQAGIAADQPDDIAVAIWNKFILLTGLSAMTAVTRMPIGEIRADPETRALLEQIMAEVLAVAISQGIELDDGSIAMSMSFVDKLPGEVRASMAVDLDQGRRLELPWLSGTVVRLGAEGGIPTPANAFVNTALKLHAMGGSRS